MFIEGLGERKYEVTLLLIVGCYTLLFSFLTILRYEALRSFAYDLGNYNQALFTASRAGRFFYYTADLPANPSGSIFGTHFLPVLFLLLPVYSLAPSVETILVIQSLVLALGAVPIFFLGRRLMSEIHGLTFSILYLASPLVEGVNWFDFHPEAFIPLGMLTAIYAMQSKRWKLYFAGILLTLSSLEFSAVLVGLYCLFIIFEQRGSIISALRLRRIASSGPVALITLATSIVWIGISALAIRQVNPLNLYYFGGISSWTKLGAPSLLLVPIKALEDPLRAIQALSFDFNLKILYATLIFGPFIPLVKAPRYFAITLPWLFVAVLSNTVPYYLLNTQYLAFYAPFLFAGTLFGLKTIAARSVFLANVASVSTLYSVFLVAIIASPLVIVPLGGNTIPGSYGVPSVDGHDKLVFNVISLIPIDASVLTQSNLFPLVSSRLNAFLFPYQTYYPPGSSFNSTLATFIAESEFILLDTKTDTVTTNWIINVLNERPTHGLYGAADGILLFKRNFHSSPVIFIPVRATWRPSSLDLLSGARISDPSSPLGDALIHPASDTSNSIFWSGPGTVIPPGSYVLNFTLAVDGSDPGFLINLQAMAANFRTQVYQVGGSGVGFTLLFDTREGPYFQVGILGVYGNNFTAINRYQTFFLPFRLSQVARVNFPGTEVSNRAAVFLGEVALTETSPIY